MDTARNVTAKLKKRLHPVGRLGAHIKHGIGASFEAYLRELDRLAALRAAK